MKGTRTSTPAKSVDFPISKEQRIFREERLHENSEGCQEG